METKNINTEGPSGYERALGALKSGKKVAREGWNGKGMYVYLNKGSYDGTKEREQASIGGTLESIEGIPGSLFNKGDKGTSTRLPNINMRTAQGSTVTGWLASQIDQLAEDWYTVE